MILFIYVSSDSGFSRIADAFLKKNKQTLFLDKVVLESFG